MQTIEIKISITTYTAAEISERLIAATVGCYSGIEGVTVHTIRGQFGDASREYGIRGAYTSSLITAASWVQNCLVADEMQRRYG